MKIFDDCWIVDKRRAEIIPAHGRKCEITDGIGLFDEPSLQFQSVIGNIPEELCGESFVYTKLGAEIGFTTQKAGWVLVLGENDPEEDSWNYLRYIITKCWEGGRFKLVAELEPGELIPGYDRPMNLYAGWCEEGFFFQSIVQRGQTAILISEVSDEYEPHSYMSAIGNSIELSLKPVSALIGKELKADPYYLPENRGYQACPSVAITEKGNVFAVFMATPFSCTHSGGENHYGYINIARSCDGGITWEDPIAVFDPDKDGPCRTLEGMLWTSPDRKRIYLSYVQAAGIDYNLGGRLGTWITYTDNPDDECPVWSDPVRAADGMADTTPLLASDGNWYFPVAFSRCLFEDCYDMSTEDHIRGIHIYRSPDCLRWEHLCYVKESNNHLSEPTIVEYETGKLMLLERTGEGTKILFASLEDPTKWTSPEPFCFDNNTGDMLMNTADTRNYLRTLPSGRMLYLFNNTRDRSRAFISAALSEDGGKTFPYVLLLDERVSSSYPDCDLTADGEILVIYDQGRSRADKVSGSEILFARITEEDIIKGELVSPRSCLKRLVARYGLAPREDSFKAVLDRLPNEICEEYKDRRSLEDYIELCRMLDTVSFK